MSRETTTFTLALPFRMGTVNCYLIQAGTGFVLIDTGPSSKRGELEAALVSAGCKPGNLDLIVLTHGDFDHTGNAAYLRDRFGSQIAMAEGDAGMAEQGDMFWNRSSGNRVLRTLSAILLGFSKSNRFEADLFIEDGYDFSAHGLDARALLIPGHSVGSIGVLTGAGDLYCGDLLENTGTPATNSIMDDTTACQASVERLRGLSIGTVYPGHGQPFPFEALTRAAD